MAQDIEERIADYIDLNTQICAAFRAGQITMEQHDRFHELEAYAVSHALTEAGVDHFIQETTLKTMDGQHIAKDTAVAIFTRFDFSS